MNPSLARLLLALSFLFGFAKTEDSSLNFFIANEEEHARILTMSTNLGSLVTCEFKYTTVPPDAPQVRPPPNNLKSLQPKHHVYLFQNPTPRHHPTTRNNFLPIPKTTHTHSPPPKKIQKSREVPASRRSDARSILGRLSGICIRKTIGYWKYELCFEGEIKQSHSRDSNSLGTYSGFEGNEHLYTSGTPCDGLAEARQSRVEFVCDNELYIRSIEEVSQCTYKIIVGAPIVCGHPEFRGSNEADTSSSGGTAEAWFMELVELDGGRVRCAAHYAGEAVANSDMSCLAEGEFVCYPTIYAVRQ